MGIFASKRTTNKANIVLVHGFWADGSAWSKVILTLQAQGHFVIAEQNVSASTLSGLPNCGATMPSRHWPISPLKPVASTWERASCRSERVRLR
jgi:hypothetical protein